MRHKPVHVRLVWKLKGAVRWLLTRLARPTYRRSLDYLTGRDELPQLLNSRGLLGVGVEVGVKEGWFSALLLDRWHGRTLFSVDPWDIELDPNGDHGDAGQAALDALHARTCDRLSRFGERSRVIREPSVTAAAGFGERSLDFVYIDAAHDLESVREDIAAWYPLVRPGGILAGHDYLDGPLGGMTCGVKSAVDEFCERERLELGVTLRDAPLRSWFVRVPDRAGAAAVADSR